MRICADDDISGSNESLLRKKGMLNAHLSDLKIIRNLVAVRKLANALAVLCGLDILGRHKMIRNQSNLILVEYPLLPETIHFLDRNRSRNIIAKYQIKICLDQLTCLDGRKTCAVRKNLLCHCHSHSFLLCGRLSAAA